MMPIRLPLGENLTFASHMSSLMNGWSERSIFIVGWSNMYFTVNILEPGEQHLPKWLLY